ncbi:DUF6233 domain-containing protein [Streptomyces sp. NPDC056580]|uniref:DUF6233 domain-containing protein n=1 Tax=Streptomyces sp. NPDC056580 TaxID=3345872 RepID=UPI00369D38CE
MGGLWRLWGARWLAACRRRNGLHRGTDRTDVLDQPGRGRGATFLPRRRSASRRSSSATKPLDTDAVHTGDCWAAAKSGRSRPATRAQAVDALGQNIPPCMHCRPDTALGVLY